MVPKGWERVKLGELLDFKNGVNTEAANYGQGSKFVNVMDIFESRFITQENIRGTVTVTPRQDAAYALRRGDILFNRTSETFDEIALSSVYLDDDHAIFGGFVIRGRPKNGKLFPEFSGYCFSSDDVRREIVRRGQGAIRSNIGQGDLGDVSLSLPPLPEQKKIAEILWTWDRTIETTEKLIANAERQKWALMGQLITGQRRVGTNGAPRWRKASLGSLGATYGGLVGKSAADFGSGRPYITYMTVFAKSFVDMKNVEYVNIKDGEHQNCVRKGDIFFTTSSETPNEVGFSSVLLDEPGECYLNSFCFGYRLHSYDELRPEYARHLLRGTVFRRTIRKLAQGATRYNLSKRELMKLEVELPPVAEQQAITAILDNAEAIVDRHKADLVALRSEKKALMQQLLSGMLRVPL